MTKGQPCTISRHDFDPCEAMGKAIGDKIANDPGKGFYLSELTNLKSLESAISSVSYRYSKKKPPIQLNYCPWCGSVLRVALVEQNEKPLGDNAA